MHTIDFTYTLCDGIDLQVSAEIRSEGANAFYVYDYECTLSGEPVDPSALSMRPFRATELKSVDQDIKDAALAEFFEQEAA